MSLTSGTKIGSYEILDAIGAGGMGEVYRAKDARLNRIVALKILPADFAADANRIGRFEQEARSASALNHPNIITIHDIGSVDSTSYIAMEFVEGKSLRELLNGPALPIRRIVQIAAQLADGLDKAHAAGIVHRDLKPENIMVSKDGFVKILDFGLAKLIVPSTDEVSALQTIPRTDVGTVLGTVGYMSPEQASGRHTDFRSDQFSLGVILYEMIAQKRPFQRKSSVETMAAIINEDPEPIGTLNSQTPPPLRWIVERCLMKDPEERYASTRDLAHDLQNIRDHISETDRTRIDSVASAGKKRAQRIWNIAASLVIIALSILLILAWKRNRAPSTSSTVRLSFLPPEGYNAGIRTRNLTRWKRCGLCCRQTGYRSALDQASQCIGSSTPCRN